ncbi:hypothetical protein [Bilifractor porci]|uniref:Uncharacterized protein n=1 Tax=Bilifractor porci TaxID=2606636 RepID=A0A7X2P8B8_9FIRM|nr:hypothetical protein [Bilifractor porci]MST81583.1 hypothetical protein [Bilifractor porci]
MPYILNIDQKKIGNAWSQYVNAKTGIKHFGGIPKTGKNAQYPYGNFQIIGRPTNSFDLENNEDSVDLTVQTDIMVSDSGSNNQVEDTLYKGDTACAEFFNSLGFQRMGNSAVTYSTTTGIKIITSRFIFRNFTGQFLKEI